MTQYSAELSVRGETKNVAEGRAFAVLMSIEVVMVCVCTVRGSVLRAAMVMARRSSLPTTSWVEAGTLFVFGTTAASDIQKHSPDSFSLGRTEAKRGEVVYKFV